MRLKMSRALKPAVPAMVRVVSDVRSRMQYVCKCVCRAERRINKKCDRSVQDHPIGDEEEVRLK